MAELKTKRTGDDVEAFLAAVDEKKRADARAICELLRAATGEEPAMWGASIVGFGRHHYRYESGREGDWFVVGFSPRKQAFTLYLGWNVEAHQAVLDRLGKHTIGKGCLYVKKLADVDQAVLRELVDRVVAEMRGRSA